MVTYVEYMAYKMLIETEQLKADRLADLDALDAANHARDLEIEHHDGSWRDRD